MSRPSLQRFGVSVMCVAAQGLLIQHHSFQSTFDLLKGDYKAHSQGSSAGPASQCACEKGWVPGAPR